MFCRNCQTIIPDDSIFCENCGAPTGLDPDQIDDSNLVPEDAVDYEIVEDEEPIRTASVPVDPVWWEPPEDGDEPIDVDIIAEFPDMEDSAEEKETEEPETEEAEESAPPVDETADYRWYPKEGKESPAREDEDHGSEGTDDKDRNTIEETEPSLAESALEAAEAAGSAVKSWASKTLKAAKAAREAAKEERKEREVALKAAEAAEAAEAAAKKAAEAAEEAEDTARAAAEAAEEREKAAGASAETEDSAWDAGETAEEVEDTVWDATEAVKAAVEAAVEAEETEDAGKAEKPALDEIMDFRWNPDAGEDTGFRKFGRTDLVETDREEPETEESFALKDLKKIASNAAEQAKPYAEKAIAALGELGKTVRTGTEKAAETAKEQFQQKKEEFQEQKEQRDLQKEQEQKEKALEQRRRENERLRELERQREEELRDNRAVIQQPGFWYGDDMPKSAADSVPARKADDKLEHAPFEETDKDAAFGEEDAPAKAEKEGVDAPREKKQDVDAPKDSKPEPLKENVIKDKLADTACFRWSADDLEKAAAGETGTETDADTEDGETGRQEEYAWNEGVSEDADENLIPVSTHTDDEPAIYRIKDFVSAPSRKGPGNSSILRIAVVIVVILILIAVIAGVAIHKAHEREEAEAAYQAELKQAHQLVKKEKYDEAEAEYLSLMDQRPEDLNPYLGLAQMYIDQERYLDAEALIDRAVEATGDKKAFARMKKDIDLLTDDTWKDGYVKVLEDNESDIRKYEETVQASCAVCDVNGDLKPELFFFTREYYGYGKLHIYTTVDDKAKEVDYECKNRGTQYQDAFYDVSSDDSSYAVFNCDEKGKFAIYCNVGHGGRSWDTTNEYELNLTGGCKQTKVIESSIVPTYDEGDEDRSEYLIDDEDISYEKYVAEFKRIINESDQVILYNGNGGDQAVWAKVKPDSVMCMSYDALMSDLKTKDDED